jgi:hypothetical protein
MTETTQIPRITLTVMFLLVLTSSAFAWAINQPTPPSNELKLARGTTTHFCESAQNLVGGDDITLKLEILKGQELAEFVETNYDDDIRSESEMMLQVPFGEIKKPWCINITVPSSMKDGDTQEIIVKASKKEVKVAGQVRFTTGQLAKITVEAKGGGEPEQYEPPDAKGVVPNETKELEYDLDHAYVLEDEVSGDNSAMLYGLLLLVGVIVVAVVVFLAKKYEVIE